MTSVVSRIKIERMLTAAAYDIHVEQLLDRIRRFHAALSTAGIPYRVVGGMGVFIHVFARNPEQARLTADVDVAVAREDLGRITEAAGKAGFRFRHVAGVDMFLDKDQPRARSAVHLIFLNERVAKDDLEPVPASEPVPTREGVLIAPVVDLVQMKLTSYRLKDQVHIQDLDHAGLITPEIEQTLSEPLRARLKEVRSKR
jgi:hypothetical protein